MVLPLKVFSVVAVIFKQVIVACRRDKVCYIGILKRRSDKLPAFVVVCCPRIRIRYRFLECSSYIFIIYKHLCAFFYDESVIFSVGSFLINSERTAILYCQSTRTFYFEICHHSLYFITDDSITFYNNILSREVR